MCDLAGVRLIVGRGRCVEKFRVCSFRLQFSTQRIVFTIGDDDFRIGVDALFALLVKRVQVANDSFQLVSSAFLFRFFLGHRSFSFSALPISA